jgi:hypothetical protein
VTETDTEGRSADVVTAGVADLRTWLGRVSVFNFVLGLIVVLQAFWSAILMHAGWYYQADFNNLASATGRSLSWSYLTASQGGHLDIVGRLVLWVLNRTIPLNYNATIGLRVIAAAAVTYLLGCLLRELVGPRRGVLAVVMLFAFSPLLVQSTLFLTSAINFLLSELLVLAALRSHVRYAVTGRRLRWAACTAIAMFAATLVAEQAAVSALALPLLTFGFLADGGVRVRLRAIWRSWPEWVFIAVPIIAFVGFYFASGKYATKSGGFGAIDAVRLVRDFWFHTLVPGLFGGPLVWSTFGGNYFAFAAPPLAERVLAVALLALVIGWTVRRTSALALLGWAIPLVVSAIGMVFVGRARYETFGPFVALHFEYASYAAIPAVLGVALAIWSTSASDIRARIAGTAVPVGRRVGQHRYPGFGRWGGRFLVVALAAASVISGATYAHAWSQSPSKGYVDRLAASLSRAGGTATVFDTDVAGDVMPLIQDHRQMSDLLALMGSDAHLNNGPTPARVVDGQGRLVSAHFLTVAAVPNGHVNSFCSDLIKRQVATTRRLDRLPHLTGWFLRVTYFQQVPNLLDIRLVTAQGKTVSPVGDSRVLLGPRLGTVYLRFPPSAPVAVRVQGVSSTTNVCLTNVAVGFPVPAS